MHLLMRKHPIFVFVLLFQVNARQVRQAVQAELRKNRLMLLLMREQPVGVLVRLIIQRIGVIKKVVGIHDGGNFVVREPVDELKVVERIGVIERRV